MTNARENHPITPPPELVRQWRDRWIETEEDRAFVDHIAIEAARWGADQELEACIAWMAARYGEESHAMRLLRAARRPKPPSLKEQALEILGYPTDMWCKEEVDTIRRALEQLDD